MEKFGLFANIAAIAFGLIAIFSALAFKMLGPTKSWSQLTDSPPFLIAAGARILAVVLMAIIYVTIDSANYTWFVFIALLFAVAGFWAVTSLNRFLRQHTHKVPLVGKDGKQLLDQKKNPRFENVVIGLETQMRDDAKAALAKARRKSGGLSLVDFMSGYGATKVNNPESIWDRAILAEVSTKLLSLLIYIFLAAVMSLYIAALIIDVARS